MEMNNSIGPSAIVKKKKVEIAHTLKYSKCVLLQQTSKSKYFWVDASSLIAVDFIYWRNKTLVIIQKICRTGFRNIKDFPFKHDKVFQGLNGYDQHYIAGIHYENKPFFAWTTFLWQILTLKQTIGSLSWSHKKPVKKLYFKFYLH